MVASLTTVFAAGFLVAKTIFSAGYNNNAFATSTKELATKVASYVTLKGTAWTAGGYATLTGTSTVVRVNLYGESFPQAYASTITGIGTVLDTTVGGISTVIGDVNDIAANKVVFPLLSSFTDPWIGGLTKFWGSTVAQGTTSTGIGFVEQSASVITNYDIHKKVWAEVPKNSIGALEFLHEKIATFVPEIPLSTISILTNAVAATLAVGGIVYTIHGNRKEIAIVAANCQKQMLAYSDHITAKSKAALLAVKTAATQWNNKTVEADKKTVEADKKPAETKAAPAKTTANPKAAEPPKKK